MSAASLSPCIEHALETAVIRLVHSGLEDKCAGRHSHSGQQPIAVSVSNGANWNENDPSPPVAEQAVW